MVFRNAGGFLMAGEKQRDMECCRIHILLEDPHVGCLPTVVNRFRFSPQPRPPHSLTSHQLLSAHDLSSSPYTSDTSTPGPPGGYGSMSHD